MGAATGGWSVSQVNTRSIGHPHHSRGKTKERRRVYLKVGEGYCQWLVSALQYNLPAKQNWRLSQSNGLRVQGLTASAETLVVVVGGSTSSPVRLAAISANRLRLWCVVNGSRWTADWSGSFAKRFGEASWLVNVRTRTYSTQQFHRDPTVGCCCHWANNNAALCKCMADSSTKQNNGSHHAKGPEILTVGHLGSSGRLRLTRQTGGDPRPKARPVKPYLQPRSSYRVAQSREESFFVAAVRSREEETLS
ncbi:hypothetical protein J3F84DRAFT_388573 [Trichoderma pleuroticola]